MDLVSISTCISIFVAFRLQFQREFQYLARRFRVYTVDFDIYPTCSRTHHGLPKYVKFVYECILEWCKNGRVR